MLRSRLIKKYFPANYKDCFRDKIYRKPYMSVNELFNLMFSQYPKWIMRMYYIRNLIVKPFGVKEVCARVRAVLRRTENQVAPQQEEKIKGGDITVDIVSHTVTKGDKSIELTAKEFDLLVMLMRNSGRVLTRDTLLDRVWGVEYFGDTRTVDVHVRYLRQKIEDNPDTPQLLQTVRGVGYKFVGE